MLYNKFTHKNKTTPNKPQNQKEKTMNPTIHSNTQNYQKLINEIINPNNTDLADIQIKENGQFTDYTFHDPRHKADYTVEFAASKFHIGWYENPPPYAPPNAQKVSILLIIDDHNRFAKTGKGNFAYVYSRLATCIIDYFITKNNNPEILTFTGHTTDMDSVYNKILDRLSKTHPKLTYHPYAPGIYISQTAINDIEDDQTKKEVQTAIQNQTQGLKNDITAYKNTKRKAHKNQQNRRWHTTDDDND